MEKAVLIISVLLVHVSLGWSASRVNSRSLQWDDREETSYPEGSQEASNSQGREDRKLVFINNKAYDISEAEEARLWEQYVEQGHVPSSDRISRQPDMDSLEAAMKVPEEEEVTSEKKLSDSPKSTRQNLDDSELVHKQGAVKASRFVADPQKAQLIEKVEEEEMQSLRDATTTPQPDEKIVTEAPIETSTVRYEYTQVSVLSFLWNEVRNLGELFGREMIGSLSGTLYYLWESLVRMLQAGTRQAITDTSNEL